MGYDQLMRPQRAGQGAEYATLNPNAVSPAFLKSLLNCTIENDLWETEPGTVQMNTAALTGAPTVGTVFQFFPESGVSRIVACGRNGTVWVSSDNGKTFRLLSSALQPNRLIVPVTGGKELTGNLKKLFLFGGGATLILSGDPGVDTGLVTPTTPPGLVVLAETGAVNLGDHEYVYTLGNSIGETAPSYRGMVTIPNNAHAKVNVTIPVGPAGTTYRKLYRTKAAGDTTTLFLLTTINNNDPDIYTDNTPDGSLGTKVAPVNNATATIHQIARPPLDWKDGNQPIGGFILEGRMAGFGNQNQQHGLYYSTREDHEDFLSSGAGFLPVFTGKGDGIKAGVYWRSQGWLLKSPRGIYRVDTSNIDPVQWQVHEHSDSVGCVGPMALTLIQGADDSQFFDDVIFVSPDGAWHRMSKTGAYQSGDVNASSISEATYGEFIRTNVDKSRLPFCQLIYFDEIEEVWGAFTQLYGNINKLRIKASLKRLPEFGIRFHHSNFPECEGLALVINADASRTPIVGGSLGIVKRAYQKVYADAGVQYQSVWETWDDNFQDIGENYKVSKKNYHFLVVEGLSVGDWPMFVEVHIDGVLQPTLLSISMKGKGSQFILDQSRLDQQALGATKPLFVVARLRGRGHRIRYRGYISTDGMVILDDIGFGQLWTLEGAPSLANKRLSSFGPMPHSSVYIDDLTVYAFHRKVTSLYNELEYYVSLDGGLTFLTNRTTAATMLTGSLEEIVGSRTIRLADGTLRVLLLVDSIGADLTAKIWYSDDVETLPTSSTWTKVAINRCVGFEASGLNVLYAGANAAALQALVVYHSEDGGATYGGPSTDALGNIDTNYVTHGIQVLCSPSPAVWCLINFLSGAIYRSVDNGATWSAALHTITQGSEFLPEAAMACMFSVSATRLVAVYRGQVATSDDAGLTWTNRQNLTLLCPVTIRQAMLSHIASFGIVAGVTLLAGAPVYPMEIGASTTAGGMWRSIDEGTTWTLVDVVGGGGVAYGGHRITGFAARKGNAVLDMYDGAGANVRTWHNPTPVPVVGQYFKIQQIQTGFSLGGFSGGNK